MGQAEPPVAAPAGCNRWQPRGHHARRCAAGRRMRPRGALGVRAARPSRPGPEWTPAMMPAAPAPASRLTVFDSVDRLGMWSLPGCASPLCGKVEYDPGHPPRLRVMEHADAAASFQKWLEGSRARIQSIRGVLETGEHVLLDDCFEHAKQIRTVQRQAGAAPGGEEIPAGTTSVANTTYIAQMYVSKAPVPDRPMFARMSVSYTSLFTWLNDYALDTKLNEDMSATITFTPPEERRTALPDDLTGRSCTATASAAVARPRKSSGSRSRPQSCSRRRILPASNGSAPTCARPTS